MSFAIPQAIIDETFAHLRKCGDGRRECQALWAGPWDRPTEITRVIHPVHSASAVGFQLDPDWLDAFWRSLADSGEGVRVQVHTHPGAAYHSATDDDFPFLSTPGFLSLVIPRLALGPTGFDNAFLALLGDDMRWREVAITDYLEVF